MEAVDTTSECDCRSLSVHSFVNHRGETMRGRRARSGTRRTRGLGEVRAVRSRSSDQLSDDLQSDVDGSVRSLPTRLAPATSAPDVRHHQTTGAAFTLRGGQTGAQVLQYNGELFIPVRALNSGLGSHGQQRPSSSQPIVATEASNSSNLPDYLYYTLRTQQPSNNAEVRRGESPAVQSSASAVASKASESGCMSCEQLKARVKRLEREKDILRSENRSLVQQLKASKRGLQALQRSSISEFEEAVYEENEALKKETVALREMLEKSSASETSHTGALCEVKELLHSYVTNEKAELNAKLASSRETIAEVQEALLEERKLRREGVSDVERQLIEENTGLRAQSIELDHKARLGAERKEELINQLTEMREKVHDLNATLGQTTGILPDLSADESEILLAPWCDIPDEVKECMDSPISLQQILTTEDGLQDKDEMIRCLWYRNKVSSKALNLLEGRLHSLGITSEDKLGHLADLERRLFDKDNQIKDLQMNLKVISNGQVEFEKQNREKMIALVQERNEIMVKLDDLMSQKRLLELEKQHATLEDSESLEILMNKLSESYEGATIKDTVDKLTVENSLLKVGRDGRPDDTNLASIHEVLHLTDPQELRTRCVQLANERDQFLRNLKDERSKNSDEKRLEHIRNLEAELVQNTEDRKELRQQVAHFTQQLSESLSKHEEQMTNKDREMTVLRLKLQEMIQERDEIKLEWEKERRNANDLKVTYHKEIKNQSHQARKEVESEVVDLRRELDLAYRQMRSAQIEKDTMLEEMKVMGTMSSDRQYFMHNLVERCDNILQGMDIQSDSGNDQATAVLSARQLLSELKDSFPEKGEELISAKNVGAQFATAPLPYNGHQDELTESGRDQTNQIESSIKQTNDISSNLLEKLNAMDSSSSIELTDLRNGIIEMTSKFDLERTAYRRQLQQVVIDLKSLKSRLKATEETKSQLEAACKAYEKKLFTVKEEASGSKTLKEENNRLLMELQQLQSSKAVNDKLISSLRSRIDQLRRERKDLRQMAGQNDNRIEEMRLNSEHLREERDKLAIELKMSHNERDRYRENFLVQQNKTSTLDQQIKVLKEEFETHHKGAKDKNDENFTLRESLMNSEQVCHEQKREIENLKDLLQTETDRTANVLDAKRVLENEIKSLKAQLLDLGDGDSMNDVAAKIQELKNTVSELRENLKFKDSSSHDLESQLMEYRDRIDELEAEVIQERSLLVVAKSRVEALEDENEWLRTQNSSLQRRAETPRDHSETKSRGELINELILRSQSKAQAMLANNPRLVRTFTPNGLNSPNSEVTEHFPVFLSLPFEQ